MAAAASTRRSRVPGFTLVEILIVVMILGILAAIVIPRFTDASDEAASSAVLSQLRHIRGTIDRYKLDHNDTLPNLITNQWDPLTRATNVDGTFNDDGAFGPYLQKAPVNAFTNSTVVAASEVADNGWTFDANTGAVTAVGYDEVTQTYTAPSP